MYVVLLLPILHFKKDHTLIGKKGEKEKQFEFVTTRKCLLPGHCLGPPGRRQRITLKREKIFGAGGITDNGITDDGITDYGRTDRRGI